MIAAPRTLRSLRGATVRRGSCTARRARGSAGRTCSLPSRLSRQEVVMKGTARAFAVFTLGVLSSFAGASRADELSALDDEFDSRASLAKWRSFDREFGWPDRLKKVDVDETTEGALSLQPHHSAWVRDRNAAFLFKDVTGDFDVRARVRVRSSTSSMPAGTWSLGGLLARMPNGLDAKTWTPF